MNTDIKEKYEDFLRLAEEVKRAFSSDRISSLDSDPTGDPVSLQKRAIIGYEDERREMTGMITDVLCDLLNVRDPEGLSNAMPDLPPWYDDLPSGVFEEVWGLAGAAEWFGSAYSQSSSAKIIGDRIYFMLGGRMRLMPQTIDADRREQLIRALLLLSPGERMDRDFHEVYMLDGTRVTIFRRGMVKNDQDVIIFRRYIIPEYSFEEQSARRSIPAESVALFKEMVACGFNVVFCGSVRSAKTTFLSTWQSYEDPTLEGVMVETDPEIPLHRLMPSAPVVQLIADGEKLSSISKNLMRSDADYFILAEARDGVALDTAIRLARKGCRRMKMTFHTKRPEDFAYDSAVEIVKSCGGDIEETARRTAGGFDYVFHFVNRRSTGEKKLSAVYEMSCKDKIDMREILHYDYAKDTWQWNYYIGEDKRAAACADDPEAFARFDLMLKRLAGEERHYAN